MENINFAPKVSPKKTIEGSIGGLIGSCYSLQVFLAMLLSRNLMLLLHVISFFYNWCYLWSILSIWDLVASSIKRYVGVKDYSNLIPGHGGILDRFDSIFFSL